MLPYVLLGLALAAAAFFLARWFVSAKPGQVRQALFWAAVISGVALGVAMLVFGRFLAAALLLPALLLLLMLRPLAQRQRAAQGATPGQSSEISTRFLKVMLDHDSGAMTGSVLDGPFAGRALQDMTEEELLSLWRFCLTEDEQSTRVLESYLDRQLGDDWREAAGGAAAAAGPQGMTRQEAFEVLGLDETAGEAEIRAAYRSMMQKLHPDQGGSDYLAAKINQAKELLLGE